MMPKTTLKMAVLAALVRFSLLNNYQVLLKMNGLGRLFLIGYLKDK